MNASADNTGASQVASISDRKLHLLNQRMGAGRNALSPTGRGGSSTAAEPAIGFGQIERNSGVQMDIDTGFVISSADQNGKYVVETQDPIAMAGVAVSEVVDDKKIAQTKRVGGSAFEVMQNAKSPKLARIEEPEERGTNDGHSRGDGRTSDHSRSSNEKGTSAGGASGSMKTILNYFSPHVPNAIQVSTANSATSGNNSNDSDIVVFAGSTSASMGTNVGTVATKEGSGSKAKTPRSADKDRGVKRSAGQDERDKESQTAAQQVALVGELRRQVESLKAVRDQAESKIARYENEQKIEKEKCRLLEEKNAKLRNSLETVHRAMAVQEARRKREIVAQNCVRLGKITAVKMGTSIQEVWEEGYATKEINRRNEELIERREELEKRKKKLASLRKVAKKGASTPAVSVDDDLGGDQEDLDLTAESDAIKFHLDQLKKDEASLGEERKLLESEKAAHQREFKRCQSEERSRFFKDLPCLNNRYLLQCLLGRGGFSEVWKALDLVELREVAVKVHQLNTQWNEERKHSYIKHVTREYTIHRELQHPRVVGFYDVFEIDINSFATVLEYCRGTDLDEKLKRMRTIPEKDAKVILMQIVSGLRYLSTPAGSNGSHNSSSSSSAGAGSGGGEDGGADDDMDGRPEAAVSTGPRRRAIIHFDLKPANILFDEMGDVKITDFGLSKIVDDSNEGTTLELTSQGAGTYWYLPPECFAKGDEPPRISSKVDIWSLGVIYYQMLFGKRPFGEGKTQERVLSEGVILNANHVHFPVDPKTPKVSDEAKDFIISCLTPDQKLRPDVHALCMHPYLRKKSS